VKLILASGSASRAQILRGAHVPFTAAPADIDEDGLKIALLASGKSPEAVAAALAEAKAVHVSAAQPDALVLGADQVLEFGGDFVSKCADLAAARALLRRLRGKVHRLISALSMAKGGKAIWAFCDTAALRMRPFSDAFLESYLSTEGEGLLAGVGCYRLEGMGAQLFESVEGDYFSILGLPLQPLLAELRKKGVIAQ
jgi:septum formation protein